MSSSTENMVASKDSMGHSHAVFLGACMPITSLRRSCSAPRDSNKPAAPKKSCSVLHSHAIKYTSHPTQNTTDELGHSAKASTPVYSSESLPTRSNWRHEGSFNWKRVTSRNHAFPERNQRHLQGIDNPQFDSSAVAIEESNVSLLSDIHSDTLPSPAHFHDPLLEELDQQLPTPPPPPRAIPPWLKLALNKSSREKSECTDPTFQQYSLTPPATPLSIQEQIDRQKSSSLEYDRYSVRIYPVLQNGVKMSDTHYWLLDPPQSFRSRRTSVLARHQSERVPPPSPMNQDISGTYLNVAPCVKLRRGLSDASKHAVTTLHKELVAHLLEDVPTATEAECQAVLIGCGYKYEEASRRLKTELLCRKGYVSRSRCKRLLLKYDWNLPVASEHALREHRSMEMKRLLPIESPTSTSGNSFSSTVTLPIRTLSNKCTPRGSPAEPSTPVSPTPSSLFPTLNHNSR